MAQGFTGYGMPAIDFSPLARLTDVYQKNKIAGARGGLAELMGQGASETDIAKALFAAGDIEGGLSLAKLAQAKSTSGASQSHQAAVLAEQARHNKAQEDLAQTTADKPTVVPVGAALVGRKGGEPLFQNRATAGLDVDTLNDMADQYLSGDKTVFQNLGRGAQGAENVIALRKSVQERAKLHGLSPAQIASKMQEFAAQGAGMRTLETQAARIEYAANTANRAIDLADAAMDKLPRSQFLPIGRLQELVAKNLNSPEQAAAFAAVNTLVNEYARVVTPTGVPTDATRHHAREMLNTAMTPDAFKATTAMMRREIESAKAALKDTRKELQDAGSHRLGGAPPPAAPQSGESSKAAMPPITKPRLKFNPQTGELE